MKFKEEWPQNKEFEALFDELVPSEGKADTLGGEVIRAVSRIVYRYYNDGDRIGQGYGNETCNPAGRFLEKESNTELANIVDELYRCWDTKYEECLNELIIAAVKFCKTEEAKKANSLDMHDFDDPSDYRYDDEDEEDDYDPWAAYDEEDEMDESFKTLNEKLEKFIETEDNSTETFVGTIKLAGDNDEHYLIKMNGVPGEFDVWAESEAELETAVQEQDWIDEFLDQLENCVDSVQIHQNNEEITVIVHYDQHDYDVCATFGADDDKPNYIQESDEDDEPAIGGMETAYVVYQDLGNGYFKILDKVIMPAPDDYNSWELMTAEQDLESKWEDKLEDPTIEIGTFYLTDSGYIDPNTDEVINFEESLNEDSSNKQMDVFEITKAQVDDDGFKKCSKKNLDYYLTHDELELRLEGTYNGEKTMKFLSDLVEPKKTIKVKSLSGKEFIFKPGSRVGKEV